MSPSVEIKDTGAAEGIMGKNAEKSGWKREETIRGEAFSGQARISVTVFERDGEKEVGGIIIRERERLEQGEEHLAFASMGEFLEGLADS